MSKQPEYGFRPTDEIVHELKKTKDSFDFGDGRRIQPGQRVEFNKKTYIFADVSVGGRPRLVSPEAYDPENKRGGTYPTLEEVPSIEILTEEELGDEEKDSIKMFRRIKRDVSEVKDTRALLQHIKDSANLANARQHIESIGEKNSILKKETLTATELVHNINLAFPQIKINEDGTTSGFFNRRRVAKLEKNDPRFAEMTRKLAGLQTGHELGDDKARAIQRLGYGTASETGVLAKSKLREGIEAVGDTLGRGFDTVGSAVQSGRDATKGHDSKWKKEEFEASIMTDADVADDNILAQTRADAQLDVASQTAGYTTENPQHGEFQKRGLFTRMGEGLNRLFASAEAKGKEATLKPTTLAGRTWEQKEKTLANMSPEELQRYNTNVKADTLAQKEREAQKFANKNLDHVSADTDEEGRELSIADYITQLKVFRVKAKPDGSIGLLSRGKHKKLYEKNPDYQQIFDKFREAVDSWNS